MTTRKYGTFKAIQDCVVSEWGTIEPAFRLRNTISSGELKYFNEYVGHTIRVTIEILPKDLNE